LNKEQVDARIPEIMPKKPGFLLVALIIIIVVFSIIIYGTVAMISQNLSLSIIRLDKSNALITAQCGVMQAAYRVQKDGNYTSWKNLAPFGNNQVYSFELLSAVPGFEYLNVDASSSELSNYNKRVNYWVVENKSTTETYAITAVKVDWSPTNPTENFTKIVFNNLQRWLGSEPSGTKVNLTQNVPIPYPNIPSGNWILFDTNMLGRTVTATFYLTNGGNFTVRLFPGPPNVPNMIKSTGKIVKGNLTTMRKTVLANFEVESNPAEYTYVDASATHIDPSSKKTKRDVINWDLINTNPAQYYEITGLQAFWTEKPTRPLRVIWLDNALVWQGSATSGTKIDFNQTYIFIPANSNRTNNVLRFNAEIDLPGQVIRAAFFTRNGLSFEAQVYPAIAPTLPTVTEGNRINIIKYKETNNHIMP